MLTISLWIKDSGNIMSHSGGLNEEQVIALHELKVGDRLICWKQVKDDTHSSDYCLKKYQKREDR